MISLICKVQNYTWGKTGSQSAVSRFLSSMGEKIDEAKPYAELWMGTHPNAPSSVTTEKGQTILLEEYLGKPLPFLFKVLSIRSALSIQAHPTLATAQELHQKSPEHYPDSNHKPEMVVALTQFEAMCSFRPHSQIVHYIKSIPELTSLLGEQGEEYCKVIEELISDVTENESSRKKNLLKNTFSTLMTTRPDDCAKYLASLLSRPHPNDPFQQDSTQLNVFELVSRLTRLYPNDIGCLCPFFLNCFVIPAGSALFLPANEPHAYLSGDAVECMASSDNVVRAGLTSKYRDVETLIQMLNYAPTQDLTLRPTFIDDETTAFIPPVSEFFLQKKHIPKHGSSVLTSINTPSIFIIETGEARITVHQTEESTAVKAGNIFYIPAQCELTIDTLDREFIGYQCAENIKVNKSRV